MSAARQKKELYCAKLIGFFEEYSRVFLIDIDMVGSKQLQIVRQKLRGKGEMLMGKNTLVRKCLRDHLEQMPKLEALLPHVGGNTGFVFCKDFSEVRQILSEAFVGAFARAGIIAPVDVHVEKQVTTLQPTETSFFQALNINTKITKGAIEILEDVHIVHKGSKVAPGSAALLSKLGIKPFTYGPDIVCVYEDGSCFDPKVLDITEDDVCASFMAGVSQVAALCLAANYPTLASLPHTIINGYKNVLCVSLACDYTYPLAEKIKAFLDDPEAMAAAAAAATAPATTGDSETKKEKASEPEPEPESEPEDDDMDFDLFD